MIKCPSYQLRNTTHSLEFGATSEKGGQGQHFHTDIDVDI